MIPKKPQPMAKADYEATAERFLTGSNAGDKTKKTKAYRYYNLPPAEAATCKSQRHCSCSRHIVARIYNHGNRT